MTAGERDDLLCSIPWSFMLISQHVKKVVACPYHTRPYGDLEQNTLEEIWNGPIAQDMRRSLLEGNVPQFCANYSVACPVITRQRAGGFTGVPSDHIEVGQNDFGVLGAGWYALETIPDPVRWTSGRAHFRILTGGKTKLHVQALSLNPETEAAPLTGALVIDGAEAGRFHIDRVGLVRLTFPVARRADAEDDVSEATLVVDDVWSPHARLGNGDTRAVGIAVKRIWTT